MLDIFCIRLANVMHEDLFCSPRRREHRPVGVCARFDREWASSRLQVVVSISALNRPFPRASSVSLSLTARRDSVNSAGMTPESSRLIKALDRSGAERQEAITKLAAMGKPVVPQLLGILEITHLFWSERTLVGVVEAVGMMGAQAECALPVFKVVQTFSYPSAVQEATRQAQARIAAALAAESSIVYGSSAVKTDGTPPEAHKAATLAAAVQVTAEPQAIQAPFRVNNYQNAAGKLLLAAVVFAVSVAGLVYLFALDPEGWKPVQGELLSGPVGRAVACVFCLALALGMLWLANWAVLWATFGEVITFRRLRKVVQYPLGRLLHAQFRYARAGDKSGPELTLDFDNLYHTELGLTDDEAKRIRSFLDNHALWGKIRDEDRSITPSKPK
jgi:hypothetical protein